MRILRRGGSGFGGRGERKKMIATIEDLIQSSHKAARSQYTPSAQRAKWTRLAGQLIWYKDQILRGMSLEAMEIDRSSTAYGLFKKKIRGVFWCQGG